MDPLDPVPWDAMLAADVRTEPRIETFVDEHRDLVAAADTVADAVSRLYEAVHEELAPDEHPPDQGLAYILGYLVEREGLATWEAVEPSLLDRRPANETLHREVVEEHVVPWWLAVEVGVHYSLVIFWCYEADVPLLWRNLPPDQKEAVEAAEGWEPGAGNS